jgi:hypothetical protein
MNATELNVRLFQELGEERFLVEAPQEVAASFYKGILAQPGLRKKFRKYGRTATRTILRSLIDQVPPETYAGLPPEVIGPYKDRILEELNRVGDCLVRGTKYGVSHG